MSYFETIFLLYLAYSVLALFIAWPVVVWILSKCDPDGVKILKTYKPEVEHAYWATLFRIGFLRLQLECKYRYFAKALVLIVFSWFFLSLSVPLLIMYLVISG